VNYSVKIYPGGNFMLTTVEAEIDVKGNVTFLEPLELTKTSRAIVTILDIKNTTYVGNKNGIRLSEFLKTPEFVNRKTYSADEIDAQIEDTRNSWE
jgi:hypothetical protein